MTAGVAMKGIYDTREELIEAVQEYYQAEVPMRQIGRECGVSLKCVRNIITARGLSRDARPVVEKVPMSVKPHELRLVREPCTRTVCEDPGCQFHSVGGIRK